MKKYSTEEVSRVFSAFSTHITWGISRAAEVAGINNMGQLIEAVTLDLNQQIEEDEPKDSRPLMVNILESIYAEFDSSFFSIRIERDGIYLQGKYDSGLVKQLSTNGVELTSDKNGFFCGTTQIDGTKIHICIC